MNSSHPSLDTIKGIRPETLREILAKAVLAPSADNLQPWCFRIRTEGIDFYFRKELLNNFCDTGYLAPYISAGAVIENFRLAAAAKGLKVSISFLPDPDNPLKVASLTLAPCDSEIHPHFEALEKRVTNRRFYLRSKALPGGSLERLTRAIEGSGCRLLWKQRSDTDYARLSRIVGDADQLRFESKRLHREFFSILRYDEDEIHETEDGLDVRTLESGPAGGLTFRLLSSWNRMTLLNRFGMSKILNRYARMQMMSSQAAGLLIGENQDRTAYLNGGAQMQRIWHEATLSGLSLQPMEALPIFILNQQMEGLRDFPRAQKDRLLRLKREFFELFRMTDEKALLFFFRIGFSRPPSARSLRRDVESFIL